jgi:hypothetical protein
MQQKLGQALRQIWVTMSSRVETCRKYRRKRQKRERERVKN